ncbi:DUF4406 domain-containing protein [Vibrio fluvialis]|uniref:DUF4406 domain-containing protein n=1 Tax=Vibrio fluvialis TaxID=676 RepID=UPI001EE9EB45|nr:DUF4406 domain-containing protein [Vibrio fluvialis]MCG6387511.1 DUF4406 domain-containing protein [Vibrio fluvialis]
MTNNVDSNWPVNPFSRMVVYISGPMAGIENFNHDAFNQAQYRLEQRGYNVLNPAKLPIGLTDSAYMDIGLAMIRASDIVLLLDGHEKSKGAQAEKAYAERIGLTMMEQSQIE